VSQISSRQLYQRARAPHACQDSMYCSAHACRRTAQWRGGRCSLLAYVWAVVKRRIIRFRLYLNMCDAMEPLCAGAPLFRPVSASVCVCVFPSLLCMCSYLRAVSRATTFFYVLQSVSCAKLSLANAAVELRPKRICYEQECCASYSQFITHSLSMPRAFFQPYACVLRIAHVN
jgi:hypothetical protein